MTERECFACVRQRPGMFFGKTSFHLLTAFLTGYDQHAHWHGGQGLTGSPVARRGRACSHAWPGTGPPRRLPERLGRHLGPSA
ncbi:hypothetical protein [Streptomyces sp. NPDC002215]|uniref:hypothetical protein n=1 Tax=Streptomyces sp. NPDC002215 TaxID=3154412 RepID=UPI003327F2BE